MAGRPKIFNEEQIIAKAGEIFWKIGYEAASTEELLKAMGIGKGSFYLSFKGGKKELFEKALERHALHLVLDLKKNLAESLDPIGDLRKFFFGLAEAEEEEKLKGCFIANTLAEMSTRDKTLKEVAAKLLSELQETFSMGINCAQRRGSAKHLDAELVGKLLLNLWNGISLSRRLYTNGELREIISVNLQVLD
ncbi:TetR/AcrR family transcriptional regulator [Pedobacter panaciterrae]|uniref:TetR/AcrR family transcriptional regulator n=1 Tax=Pedobacter panaciterrae TaxID=363849 RepID=UPI00155DCA90|nr:TetR/AcrR family transcriptional regulator [Pedobacter panaciterrae]NQX54038.1 TetR/AcrR family transcriptional regulator [Pedobacter panaciterrae]